MIRTFMALLALVVLLSGCEEYEFKPPDREAQVADAGAAFRLETYDTVTWESDSTRALQGSVVWSAQCRNCHGTMGAGATDYSAQRALDVPSLVEAAWVYAESRDSVLYRIHSGHGAGMPTWSVAGISPREIDAVTHYLMDVLRPEVLDGR